MNIKTFQGGYDKNLCYLYWCNKTKHAALIDASVEINPILEFIEKNNLILSKILITHTHHDHIVYINDWLEQNPLINIYCYNKSKNLKFQFIGLLNNEMISIGNEILIAMHTPGHFYDSMCFWSKDDSFIFTGDTMFVGRTGRTISAQSNISDLYNSIYKSILALPDKTIIFPGHHYGYKKTISLKENKQLSNFFTCNSLDNFKKVMENYEKNR